MKINIHIFKDRNKLWTARHKLFYAGLNMIPGARGVTTDACVPVSKLPEMLIKTREDIDAAGLTGNYNLLPNHSSKIRSLCLKKYPSEMLQNLPYFIHVKTQSCFFRFLFHATLFFP